MILEQATFHLLNYLNSVHNRFLIIDFSIGTGDGFVTQNWNYYRTGEWLLLADRYTCNSWGQVDGVRASPYLLDDLMGGRLSRATLVVYMGSYCR